MPSNETKPETISLDNAADMITGQCFEIAAHGEPHASYAREMQRVAMAGLDLRRRYEALEAENARLTRELSESRARAVQGEASAVELLRQIVALWDKTRGRSALGKDHMNDFARLMDFTRRLIGAPEFGAREETTNG